MRKKPENFTELERSLSQLGGPSLSSSLQRRTLGELGLRQPSRIPLRPLLVGGAALAALLLCIRWQADPQPVKAISAAPELAQAQAKNSPSPRLAVAPASPKQAAPRSEAASTKATAEAVADASPLQSQVVPVGKADLSAPDAKAATSRADSGSEAAAYSIKIKLNRFRPARGERVTLEVTLNTASEASLRVFDSQGREVARPFEGLLPGGFSVLSWDGGQSASGAYVLFFQAGKKTERIPVLLVR